MLIEITGIPPLSFIQMKILFHYKVAKNRNRCAAVPMSEFVGADMNGYSVKRLLVHRGCVGITDTGQVGDTWNR